MHERLTNDEKKSKVKKASYEGYVVLCTRTFGRGTDFYQSEKLEEAGGIHVIQTFFTEDFAEEVQIRGRTRRQGNPGSFEMILSVDGLISIENFITEKDLSMHMHNLGPY